jgi:hypothetical protein
MSKMILTIGTEGENLGRISIEGDGFDGENCVKTIDELQEILGLSTQAQEDKPERQRRVSLQKQGW